VALRLFALLALVFMLVTSREPPWADAHVVYDTTQALVDQHALDVHTEGGPPWWYVVRDGRRFGVFPLGNVIAMVPSYLAYKALRHFDALPDRPLFAFLCHLSPSLLMAAACALFFGLCRRQGASRRWAVGATLTLALATIVFVYARSPYAEALQTAALMWLVERALAQAERPTMAGMAWLALAAGTLVNAKLVYVLVLPAVALYLAYERRRDLRSLVRALPLATVVFAATMALVLWHNHVKTGSLWRTGYQDYKEGVFSGDAVTALYGFALSSGKSIFLYSPPIVLGILGLPTAWRRSRGSTAFILAIVGIVVAFNAKFPLWHGDYCWGPRYLTPIVPLVFLLAFPWLPEAIGRGRAWLRRCALGAVVAAGIGVQLLGASFYWDHFINIVIAVKDQTGAAGWFRESLSQAHFMPEFSPVRGHAWLLSHLVRGDRDLDHDAPWKKLLPEPLNLDRNWTALRFDWWPLEWLSATIQPEPRRPPRRPTAATATMLLLLFAGVVLSGRGVVRHLDEE
jgi:hypothetical protein